MRRLAPLLTALALGAPAGAQVSTFPYAARVYQVTGLPTCTAALSGRSYGVYDGADAEDCDEVSGGGGTHDHSCLCDGSSWVAIARRDEVPDGSGTANQIAYWSDTDTLTSASSAVIEAGAGANTLVVDSSSRVGIGTAAPTTLLQVEGAGTQQITFKAGAPLLDFVDTDITGPHRIQAINASLVLHADPDNADSGSSVQFRVDGSTIGGITSTGLGSGTTAPAKLLHVNSASDTDILRLQDSDGTCDMNPESGAITDTCTSSRERKKDIRKPDKAKLWKQSKDWPLSEWETIETDETRLGAVAEDVAAVLPDRVVTWPEREVCTEDDEGIETCVLEPETLAVELPSVWELLAVIQQLQERVEDLEKKKPARVSDSEGGRGLD